MLTFSHPWLLYFLWLVPAWVLLVLAAWRHRQRKMASFVTPPLLQRLAPRLQTARDIWQLALVALAYLLLLLAAAGPQWGHVETKAFRSGRDIVILVDVSRSMLVRDVYPTRLARAKADLLDLVEILSSGDRVALYAFRHRPVRILPFTSDRRFLQHALQSLSIHSAPPGATDIAIAVQQALSDLPSASSATQAVILLSDGENLEQGLAPALETAKKRGIPFVTVGIGSHDGGPVPSLETPDQPLRIEGEAITSRLVDDTLERLAHATGGTYIPIETAGLGQTTLGQLVRRHLKQIEAQSYQMMDIQGAVERYQWFLLPAIILLLAVGVMSRGRLATGLPRTAAVGLILLCMAATATAASPPVPSHRELAYRAQQQHRDGAFEQAATLYEQAADIAADSPERANQYRLNAAIARIANQQYEPAAELLRGLPASPTAEAARALTYYQRGNQTTNTSAQALQQRAEWWRDAAQLLQQIWRDTDNPDAAQDLAMIAEQLPRAAEQATRQEWIERYAETNAAQLAWEVLQQQRSLQEQAQEPLNTTNAHDRIRQAEERAAQWQTLANTYYPLAHKQAQSGQQNTARLEQEQARLRQQTEHIRDLLPPDTLPPLQAGHPVYDSWKDVATYEQLLAETRRQQAETLERLQQPDPRPDQLPLPTSQAEAADLTGLFAERFSPPQDTPPETSDQILELADRAESLQRLAAEMLQVDNHAEAATTQREALDILDQLQDLLPQPPPQEQEQQQDESEEPSEDPSEEPDASDDEADNNKQDGGQQQPPPDTPQPDEPDDAESPEEEQDVPIEIEAMLEQVQEREREYEERKLERMRRITPQSERDW